jgi:hypothetical protein
MNPIATPVANCSWRELYLAALFEVDRHEMHNRIDEAERAIINRTRQLFASTCDAGERHSLNAALEALRALRGCVEPKLHPGSAA